MSETRDLSEKEIGGIPLPERFPEISLPRDKFRIFAHRGFGEKTLSAHRLGEGLVGVENQLTGFETAIAAGADTLEIDLTRTIDGKIVTHHLSPAKKLLDQTEAEYLSKHPEAFTLSELMDWLSRQNPDIRLYLELKSDISLAEITSALDKHPQKLRQQIMIYGADTNLILKYLEEKQKRDFNTNEFKLWWLTNGLVSKELIDKIASLGNKECRLFGIEQGMMPWGTKQTRGFLEGPLKHLPGLSKINQHFLKNFGELVRYAHDKGLQIVTGTVDDARWINTLVKQGVDGIIPNNPVDFEVAGVARPSYEQKIELGKDESGSNYITESMKLRLRVR